MKHNGVVTRILKTSSTASGSNAGSVAKARPAVAGATPRAPVRDKAANDIVSELSDLAVEAERTPAFASTMEREIAAILARATPKPRGGAAETPVVPAPAAQVAAAAIAQKEGDRVTVRAPGQGEAAPEGGPVHVPAPPRPPPLPAEMRDAVTARPPGRREPPPFPPRAEIVPVKPHGEPVRVQVKPPPLSLPLSPRRDVHVDVIDAPAETRREPCGRERREPPVELWADSSLVESIPPSDPNEVLPPRRSNVGAPRQGVALAGQIVLYGTATEAAQANQGRPALPPALPPGPAPQPAAAQAAAVVPVPVAAPATAWVQQHTMTTRKPLRARLQAAALGIAAGVAISMVVTWRPQPSPQPSSYALGAAPEGAAAMMTPSRPAARPSTAQVSTPGPAEPLATPAVQTAAQAAATKDGRPRPTVPVSAPAQAKPPASAGATTPVHAPQASARASTAAPENQVAKGISLSGRVTGDDE